MYKFRKILRINELGIFTLTPKTSGLRPANYQIKYCYINCILRRLLHVVDLPTPYFVKGKSIPSFAWFMILPHVLLSIIRREMVIKDYVCAVGGETDDATLSVSPFKIARPPNAVAAQTGVNA